MQKSRHLRRILRRLNLQPRRAILADRAGVLYEPGRPGYVRVRYPASPENTDALAYPTTVRLNAIVPMRPGQPVLVGYDADNEVAVVGGDFSGALASGGNPLVNNPSDDNVFRYLDQRDVTTLRCQRVGPGAPMSVSVLGWPYIVTDGTYHGFIGQQISLTASIPGSANQQRLALIALKTDDTLEIATSTAQDLNDALDETDIQECITALSAQSTPVHLWRLETGMAALTDDHDYMDMRQFLNIRSGASVPVMTAAQMAAISSPAEGLMVYANDTDMLHVYDVQRFRNVASMGFAPYAYPLVFEPSLAFTTALTLAANGGSIAIPIHVAAQMVVESVAVRNTDADTERTWAWDLYAQYLNNGNGSENTLARVIASNGSETFTPGAASIRTLAATADTYIGPGVYWLVIQSRHATSTFGLGSTAASAAFAVNTAQTKTTTNPNGATLDLVAATWTKITDTYAVRLNGVVFGQAVAF